MTPEPGCSVMERIWSPRVTMLPLVVPPGCAVASLNASVKCSGSVSMTSSMRSPSASGSCTTRLSIAIDAPEPVTCHWKEVMPV